jgi:hypothetical protein
VGWNEGTYAFDPAERWTPSALVSMNVESGLMEAARRCDEIKRFRTMFADPQQVIARAESATDAESLGADEDVLLAAVDGEHTVAELVADAPMVSFEAHDALARLLEAGVIRFAGRRANDAAPAPVRVLPSRAPVFAVGRELAVAAGIVALVIAARWCAHGLEQSSQGTGASDVYAAAAVRDLRATIELYARDHGHLPARLSDLSEDRWIEERHLRIPGQVLRYRVIEGGADYELALQPDR